MARTIAILCDRHLGRDERVEGREVPVWGGRILALCQECEVELYKPLADVVEEFGVREDSGTTRRPYKRRAPRATPETTTATGEAPGIVCAICGHPYATESGLRQHVPKVHGETMRKYRERL